MDADRPGDRAGRLCRGDVHRPALVAVLDLDGGRPFASTRPEKQRNGLSPSPASCHTQGEKGLNEGGGNAISPVMLGRLAQPDRPFTANSMMEDMQETLK